MSNCLEIMNSVNQLFQKISVNQLIQKIKMCIIVLVLICKCRNYYRQQTNIHLLYTQFLRLVLLKHESWRLIFVTIFNLHWIFFKRWRTQTNILKLLMSFKDIQVLFASKIELLKLVLVYRLPTYFQVSEFLQFLQLNVRK